MNWAQILDPRTLHPDPLRLAAVLREQPGQMSLQAQLEGGLAHRRLHERTDAPRSTWTRNQQR